MREITLTRGFSTKIDDEDFERVIALGRWYADIWHGARVYAKHGSLYLHRFILPCEVGKDIDHINGDSLDNRKENLRACTRSENMLNKNVRLAANNKSGFKGVYFDSFYYGWKAEYRINGRKFHLGVHNTIEAVVEARKKAELRVAEGLLPK